MYWNLLRDSSNQADAWFTKQGVNLPECAKAHAPYFVMAPHQSGTDGFFGAVLVKKEMRQS